MSKNNRMPTEQELLTSLGITDPKVQQQITEGTVSLLILDASAHLDWDWLLPYPALVTGGLGGRAYWYFSQSSYPVGCVDDIVSSAASLLTNNQFHYSICETGFLRGFATSKPDTFAQLIKTGQTNNNLRFTGGGITSPDNLLTHGETFIRDYLIGNKWLADNCPGLPAPMTAWIPDDFGHDPQLPVVLQAMGFIAAGFERIPGNEGGVAPPVSGAPTLVDTLTADKIDFTWTASDGSSVTAHWLIGGYGQGNSITGPQDISNYLKNNFNVSPTSYIYVPVLSDFSMPNTSMVNAINQWNAGGGTYGGKTVIAVSGSFEDYGQLLQFHSSSLSAPYGQQFNANPFWTGCSGTRPALKILHQRATRNLLAAEVFSILANWAQPGGGTAALGTGLTWAEQLQEAWNLLVPSTHHDYIPGTAIPDVFRGEQLPLLHQADERAAWLLQEAMNAIAGAVNQPGEGTPVVVFNPLGIPSTGVASLTARQIADGNITLSGNAYQTTEDGGLLFMAGTVPSMGYQTSYLVKGGASPDNPATISTSNDVVLSNGLVSATLAVDTNNFWQLVSVKDLVSGAELLQQGSPGNQLLFYADGGDEYGYGMEFGETKWIETDISTWLSDPAINIIESGPLRVVVRISFTYSNAGTVINYIQDYIMHANEPMLRMRTTGAAPLLSVDGNHGCAVVVSFPLANRGNGIEQIVRGTPYHWTDVQGTIYWNQQTFLPTHNFVIPQNNGEALCAIYHQDIPGWGLYNIWNGNSFDPNNGVLYGGLFRNGDGHYYEWVQANQAPYMPDGTDPDVHVREYALRIPSGFQSATSCQPLQESLIWSTPLQCVQAASWTGAIPDNASLASCSSNAAVITVAKQGTVNQNDVVFRIYQPTNAPQQMTLIVAPFLNPAGGNIPVTGQTALEQNLSADKEAALNLQTNANTITFQANNAITTLAVSDSLTV